MNQGLTPLPFAHYGQPQDERGTHAADLVPGSQVPPWSAAHPYVNLYTHRNPVGATVVGNYRVTENGAESDTHHIVLDFGSTPFPVLEGQSLGIVPPGADAGGRIMRASIRSPARATANAPATTTCR